MTGARQATETRIPGSCLCGRKVIKIEHSERPTCRTDGKRYIYADKPDKGWCIFRCEDCHAVIDEAWKPDAAGEAGR